MKKSIPWKRIGISLLGSAILAFGIYQIHARSEVTEGGVIGLTLLIQYWLHISPAFSSLILDGACYLFGFRQLGWDFVRYSALSSVSFSAFYAILERFPPLWPQIADYPLAASVVGALFVGVGAGLCVRCGGAPGGDDALAMGLSHRLHVPIEWMYLISDLLVLGFSLSYIPLRKILYSLLTVILSGQIAGWTTRVGKKKEA